MELLLTCHRDPFSYIGGSETVVRELALRFCRMGHRVVIATKREPDVPYSAGYDEMGKRTSFSTGPTRELSVLTFESNGRGPWKTNWPLSDFMGYYNWDAILLYGQNVWITDEVWREVGRRWKKYASRARVLYAPVGFPHLFDLYYWPYYHVVQDHLIEQSDVTVALTDNELKVIPHIGKPKSLVKIPNGVDCAEFEDGYDAAVLDKYGIQSPYIMNVGGDYENKCVVDACLGVRKLNTFAALRHQLVLVGPQTEHYSNSWVRGLGIVPEEDKVALYHEADSVLQVSDFEGFGLTLLEALASGVPFVSTRVGAAEELANQYGGTLINTRSPASIAYHLYNELMTERDEDELRAIAARYDWDKIATEFERVMHG